MKQIIINETIAQKLIQEQFPMYKNLEIQSVTNQGHDHKTFRLGNNLLLRLPTATRYAININKEALWLPQFTPSIATTIPMPITVGKPTTYYPCYWSIYQWIEGQSANNLTPQEMNLNEIALSLAEFLQQLASIDTKYGPKPGPHNFYRGAHPSVYFKEIQTALQKLSSFFDVGNYERIAYQAIQNSFTDIPVWVHGDISPGNIIIKNKKLNAVIDFSGIAVGDPACDLTIAWTFFDQTSKEILKSNLPYNQLMWEKAQAWALWKSLITLADIQDMQTPAATTQINILHNIAADERIKYYFQMTPKNLRTFTINSHEKIEMKLFHSYDQIHCCYHPQIYFMQYNHKLSINKHEDFREIAERFIRLLEHAINNELSLPNDIQDLGIIANHYDTPQDPHNYYKTDEYNQTSDILNQYQLLRHNYFTFLYNDKDGNIILQISPEYPFQNKIKKQMPSYNNFLRWMKQSYKPTIIRMISKKIAQTWLEQARQISAIINNNIHEAFKKE